MSKQAIKTNNDNNTLNSKVQLRLKSLPAKKNINVLEAFGGDGILWDKVKKLTDKKINILSIDKNDYRKVNLKGDNIKFMLSLDLNKFDIIDLDAWGSPSEQLEILKNKNYKGIVHCTFIQTMFGSINNNILLSCGYSLSMIQKCPSIFYKNGIEKMMQFIYNTFSVTVLNAVICKKKNYFYFEIK